MTRTSQIDPVTGKVIAPEGVDLLDYLLARAERKEERARQSFALAKAATEPVGRKKAHALARKHTISARLAREEADRAAGIEPPTTTNGGHPVSRRGPRSNLLARHEAGASATDPSYLDALVDALASYLADHPGGRTIPELAEAMDEPEEMICRALWWVRDTLPEVSQPGRPGRRSGSPPRRFKRHDLTTEEEVRFLQEHANRAITFAADAVARAHAKRAAAEAAAALLVSIGSTSPG